MTTGLVVVSALVLTIAVGRFLRHFGNILRRQRSERNTEMSSKRVLTAPPAPYPLRLYHWRWEIFAVTLLPYGVVMFGLWAGTIWSAAALTAGLGTAILRRRQARARFRAIVLQHRLRAAFPLLRLPGGRRPAILWTRPRGGDVVVSLYCPGGTSFDELHRRRAALAVALAAPDVYVHRHPRFAAFVTLTVGAAVPRLGPARPHAPGNVVPLRVHS
jgi:hypothetical protein